jgi:glutaryl-CoA dehydrogenase
LRASITGEIVMDNVEVAKTRCCRTCRGLKGPVRLSQPGALRHLLGCDGCGGRLLAPGAAVWLDRKQFGKPLAGTQLFQKKLADMQTEIALGLQGSLRVGRLMDEGASRRK